MILTFEDDEKELFQNMVNYVNDKMETVVTFGNIKDKYKHGDLQIDIYKRIVSKGNIEIKLTFTEFEILLFLAKNAGRVYSKEQIYDIVWKEPYFGDYNIVMSHIRNIREKIEDNPKAPVYIQTVWGVGYRFNKNLSSGMLN